jgi:glycosyltransferase involved in cell wall biosynthesis
MISIIIPAFDEEKSLAILYREIDEVARAQALEIEVLFIDDGSRDQSWPVICALAKESSCVRGIRLRRNFGKAAALSAGVEAARGTLLLTMDADLQDDPHEIPGFLAKIEQGYEVVSGWKRVRHDPWHKVLPSRVFNWMVSWLTGVRLHDHNCGMKCYQSIIFREIRLYGELHRFIPVLAAARGFKVGELVIQHRRRAFGYSKYGFRRFAKGFLDLLTVKFLTGFGERPSHALGGTGLFFFAAGLLGMAYLTITWFVNVFSPGFFLPLHERPLLLYSVAALLMGAQMMSMGFLAEMITAYQGRSDTFSIAERTETTELT